MACVPKFNPATFLLQLEVDMGEEGAEDAFSTPSSRYDESPESPARTVCTLLSEEDDEAEVEDESLHIDDIPLDDSFEVLGAHLRAMGFDLVPVEMNELISSIYRLQKSLFAPITLDRVLLSERIEELLTKGAHQCHPHNQKNIVSRGLSKVHVGSFDPREGPRVKSAIVKHLPLTELYLIVMETFVNYFLKHIVQTDFVGDVYQVFFTNKRNAVCVATEPVGDRDLSNSFSSDPRVTYYYIHDVAIILESLQAECGFIHGDLKADNLRIDDMGYISLIDFGQSCITYNGVSYFEPVSLVLPEEFCKETRRYEYNPMKTFSSKHRFSGDLLYFLLTMMLYHIVDEETGTRIPIPDTYLGTRLVRDFFTFQLSDGTSLNVYNYVRMCPLHYREYVFSKDPEILFQWVPILETADQDRFLEQFTPSNVVKRILQTMPSMAR